MKKILAKLTVILLISAPVLAQDMCVGDFDYDGDCDGSDAARFKLDFGRSVFTNPCPLDGPAPVPKTGQEISYAIGDDGDLEKGLAWPNPRFTDNSDGTVTDNLTGLIWLKNANCFGQRQWSNALYDANGLASGSCGLTDGSISGDWRLPNKNELASLVHNEYYNPALPNTEGTGQWSAGDPFSNVQSSLYWSSSTDANYTGNAWRVYMGSGYVDSYPDKTFNRYVWPVRGGQ